MKIGNVSYIFLMAILLLLIFQIHAFESGNIAYTLHRESNPTSDQIDAYRRIKIAMDSALGYFNRLTTITKTLNVYYKPGVPTANGNFNGTIRFGANRYYMVVSTAMHEIAHTVGVGTTAKYKKLVKNRIFTGSHATAALREITGDSEVLLNSDSKHFWPYGLNYVHEMKSEQDLINHCKIVNAIYKDLFGEEVFFKRGNLKSVYDNRCINAVDNSKLRLGGCNTNASLVTVISLDANVYRIEFGNKVLDIPNKSRKADVIAALYGWNGGENQRVVFEFKDYGQKDSPFSIRMRHSGLYLQEDGDLIVQRALIKRDDRFYWNIVDKHPVTVQNNRISGSMGKIEIKIVDGLLQVGNIGLHTKRMNIYIVDMQGRVIYQKESDGNFSIAFNSAIFAKGVYLAYVYSGNWAKIRTFFVK